MTRAIPIALTIAGSDSSGGAGIQADLKTFSALGVYGASVLTALTAQNTQGVHAIHAVPADFISAQLAAVFDDLDIAAIKIGVTGTQDAIAAIAESLEPISAVPVILDPVMVAESGDSLLDDGAESALREKLFPLAALITPNLEEAGRLLNSAPAATEDEMKDQAQRLQQTGPRSVLIKGGHGSGEEAIDIYYDGENFARFAAKRVDTKNNHGTGCTLSAAIAAFMARGTALQGAIGRAKRYLTEALAHADELDVGRGPGPVNHMPAFWQRPQDPENLS